MTKAPATKDSTPKKKVRMKMTPAHIRARRALQQQSSPDGAGRPVELRPVDPRPSRTKETPAPPAVVAESSAVLQVQMVALDRIKADPTQPRKDFAPEEMAELVESIKKRGVELPIRLRPMSRWRQIVSLIGRQHVKRERKEQGYGLSVDKFWEAGIQISAGELISSPITDRLLDEGRVQRGSDADNYKGFVPGPNATAPLSGEKTLPGEQEWLEIVYGERRWRGSKEAGLAAIPARVSELDDIDAAELQAIENLDRASLKPVEEAAQYRKLLDTPGYGMDRLIQATGKAKNTIYSRLKLLDCPEDVLAAVAKGVLPDTTAEMIGRLSGDIQAKAAKAILNPQGFFGYGDERPKVLPHREAQRKIDEIKSQEKSKEDRAKLVQEVRDSGLTLLSDAENERATAHYSESNKTFTGYVEASAKCLRDPKGRTWSAILGKNGLAPQKAAIVRIRNWVAGSQRYETTWASVKVYPLQEANDALKKLGLWEAEGSKKAAELEEKRQAKEAGKARVAKMHADLDELVRLAQRKDCRPVLMLALEGLLTNYQVLKFVAGRRNLAGEYPGRERFLKLASSLPVPEVFGLIAEIAVCCADHEGGEPRDRTLTEALKLLRGDSADVRKDEEAAA